MNKVYCGKVYKKRYLIINSSNEKSNISEQSCFYVYNVEKENIANVSKSTICNV